MLADLGDLLEGNNRVTVPVSDPAQTESGKFIVVAKAQQVNLLLTLIFYRG